MDIKMGDVNVAAQSQEQPPPYSGPAPVAQPTMTVIQPATVQYTPAVVQTTTVVSPAVVVGSSMAPGPTPFVCTSCGLQIVTRVQRVSSWRTHLCAGLLCLCGLWPCACIPYCVDTCKKAEHYCPHCNAYLGAYFG